MRQRKYSYEPLASVGLTKLLRTQGTLHADGLLLFADDDELGRLSLNDCWNNFHRGYDQKKHNTSYKYNPDAFYGDNLTPILSITVGDDNERTETSSIKIFRPADVSLSGIGRTLVKDLHPPISHSPRIIFTQDSQHLANPQESHLVSRAIITLLNSQ
jgi:hypothetical protein